MALYTRQDYEADLARIDAMRVDATRHLLAGNGIDKRKIDGILDDAERKCKQRLVMTGLIIRDRERMRRSLWFGWVWWRKNAPPKLWRDGTLRETTKAAIRQLAHDGVTLFATRCGFCGSAVSGSGEGLCGCKLIYLKRGGKGKAKSQAEQDPQAVQVPLEVVSLAEAKLIADAGGRVQWRPSGRLDDNTALSADTHLLPVRALAARAGQQ